LATANFVSRDAIAQDRVGAAVVREGENRECQKGARNKLFHANIIGADSRGLQVLFGEFPLAASGSALLFRIMATCLVSGATGFMGTCMVETLRKAGHSIRATDLPGGDQDDPKRGRFPALLRAWGIELVASDLTKDEGLDGLVQGVDYVFHI